MDFLIGVLSGIVASLIIKWLEFVFRNNATEKSRNPDISEQYINKIAKQFYVCFPIGIICIVWRCFTPGDSFLAAFQITIATLMLMLALFAFMCAMEVIEALKNRNSNNEPNDEPTNSQQ